MDALLKKFREDVFKEFEEDLNALDQLDQLITDELDEIEEESIIVEHKAILFLKRKIKPEKVDVGKLTEIEAKLVKLESLYVLLKISFGKVKFTFKNPDVYEQKLMDYLDFELKKLFSTISSAREKCSEIKEYLAEFAAKELLDEITLFDSDLEQIRKFIRQIKYYSTFLEERTKQKPYIDAKVVIKANAYKADCKKYSLIRKDILATETEIETKPTYKRKLHPVLVTGTYRGKLHARIDLKLRIIYDWDADKKILTYLRIMTHTELDQTRGG